MDRISPLLRSLRTAVLDAWALVQPVDCLGCGAPDRACCAACRASLAAGTPAGVRCDADPGAPVLVAADYTGAARGAVLALKDDGRVDAARPLGAMLRRAVAAVPAPSAARLEMAWVPSRAAALRRRGFDPVREILRAARLPASPVLVAKAAPAQKGRRRAERLAAGDRFRARGRLAGRTFVLVDDVVTTGATLAAAAAAIRAAGGGVVAAVAVAAPNLDARRTPIGDR